MAKASPTDLANLLESLSVTDNASTAEQALSNLFGVEVPLDDRVEGAAGFFAEELGLQSTNSLFQTSVFVLTKAAILGTAQLVGIGGGLAKLDLLAFKMAQLKKQVEETNKKLDVILSAPLKQAVDLFGKAMRHMENESISGTIKELEKVRDHAVQAFHYAEGQGPKTENMKSAVSAKQLVILSEILTQSYNGTTIVPFPLLDAQKKRTISSLVEDEVRSLQRFHDSFKVPMLTWNKAEKAKAKQDITDSLLRTAYPFISEGKGLTSSLTSLELPYNLKLLAQFLPEGEEDATFLTVGQHEGKPFALCVWRDGELAICKPSTGPSWAWEELPSAKITGIEVTLNYNSGLLSNIEQQDYAINPMLSPNTDCKRNKMMQKVPSLNKKPVLLPEPAALPLSLPQPSVLAPAIPVAYLPQPAGHTFNDCLLLHRLLTAGLGEEVQRRRQELSPSLLSHTCQLSFYGSTLKKVRLDVKLDPGFGLYKEHKLLLSHLLVMVCTKLIFVYLYLFLKTEICNL